jgi:hypothetical protein
MDSIKNTLKSATGKDSQSQSQFEKGMFYIGDHHHQTLILNHPFSLHQNLTLHLRP